jgi:hypothetical protein
MTTITVARFSRERVGSRQLFAYAYGSNPVVSQRIKTAHGGGWGHRHRRVGTGTAGVSGDSHSHTALSDGHRPRRSGFGRNGTYWSHGGRLGMPHEVAGLLPDGGGCRSVASAARSTACRAWNRARVLEEHGRKSLNPEEGSALRGQEYYHAASDVVAKSVEAGSRCKWP